MQPPQDVLVRTIAAMITLTTLVVLMRAYIRFTRPKSIILADYILLAAYAVFIGLTSLFLVATPALYRFDAASKGEIEMYPTFADDLVFMRITLLTNSYTLWTILWLVKFAFLSVYYKLVAGLPVYQRWWWIVFVFCVVTFLGNIPAHLVSCRKLDFFEPQGCNTRQDQIGQLVSLYYSYAADVATDLAIMILPLNIIRKLQRSRREKAGVAALFCIGIICIVTATIRVVKLGEGDGQFIPAWLAMWGSIEAAIVILVGCAPALYITLKEAQKSRTQRMTSSKTKSPFGTQGYGNIRSWRGSANDTNSRVKTDKGGSYVEMTAVSEERRASQEHFASDAWLDGDSSHTKASRMSSHEVGMTEPQGQNSWRR